MDVLKQYILSRPALNKSKLADEIGANVGNFHQWLYHNGSMGESKIRCLEMLLRTHYGYGRCSQCGVTIENVGFCSDECEKDGD